MYRYNLKVINRHYKNPIDFFKEHYFKVNTIPYYKVINTKCNKPSFILNIIDLVLNELNGTKTEQLIYLQLLSKRSYIDYAYKGIKHLPIYFCDYDINKLKHNRLLIIDDNIKFKYEEIIK